MALTRWDARSLIGGGDARRLRHELNRLFSNIGRDWPGLAGGYPALNVWQDQPTIYVEAELPGMDLNDLEIYVTGGDQLTIKGERKPIDAGNGTWLRRERGFGQFVRVITLPVPVDADKVEARLTHGVLHLTLPKSEAAKPKKIPVKAE